MTVGAVRYASEALPRAGRGAFLRDLAQQTNAYLNAYRLKLRPIFGYLLARSNKSVYCTVATWKNVKGRIALFNESTSSRPIENSNEHPCLFFHKVPYLT